MIMRGFYGVYSAYYIKTRYLMMHSGYIIMNIKKNIAQNAWVYYGLYLLLAYTHTNAIYLRDGTPKNAMLSQKLKKYL